MSNAVQSEVGILSSVNLKMTDPDYFPAIVANRILGGDFNSYLNMNLREDHGWTYGARSVISGNKYVGKFRAGASVRKRSNRFCGCRIDERAEKSQNHKG